MVGRHTNGKTETDRVRNRSSMEPTNKQTKPKTDAGRKIDGYIIESHRHVEAETVVDMQMDK